MSGIKQNGIIRDRASSSVEAAAPPPLEVTRILRQQTWIRAKKMGFLYVLLALPVVLLFVFNYLPMYGVLIAFVDYRWGRGVFGSTWNNFEHFRLIYEHPYFGRLMFNTVYISLLRSSSDSQRRYCWRCC
jgi:ABC-type polysaccharide transport system permease subunit